MIRAAFALLVGSTACAGGVHLPADPVDCKEVGADVLGTVIDLGGTSRGFGPEIFASVVVPGGEAGNVHYLAINGDDLWLTFQFCEYRPVPEPCLPPAGLVVSPKTALSFGSFGADGMREPSSMTFVIDASPATTLDGCFAGRFELAFTTGDELAGWFVVP